MEIIQWLKERDVTHFVVLFEKFPTHPHILSQINSCLSNKKITIVFHFLNEVNSFNDASGLIDKTTKLAPVDSIFFVDMVSVLTNVKYKSTKILNKNRVGMCFWQNYHLVPL